MLKFLYHSCCSYYSLHGHVENMAREVQRGANTVQGVEATLWQVVLLVFFSEVISEISCLLVSMFGGL